MNILYITLLLCVVRHVLVSGGPSVPGKPEALAQQSSEEDTVERDPKAQRLVVKLSGEQMANALIETEEEEEFVQTFKKFENEQDNESLFDALYRASRVPKHRSKVIACLRVAVDPFPNEASNVNGLVHWTLMMSVKTDDDAESFANLVAPLKPDDVKLLASFRYCVLRRKDAVGVLEKVMAKSPALITGTLPSWLSCHGFDQDSSFYTHYKVARDQAFQYLSSFATEKVLNDALSLVMKNEHYKVGSRVWCCKSQDLFPHDLSNKLGTLLKHLKGIRERIEAVLLPLLPKVLVDLIMDHVQVE